MSNLIPVPAPALQPLAQSFEFDLLETELKRSFMAVFESMIRPRERSLNLTGMAHLGDDDLMANALKADGIAMVKRSSTRMQFLMKANRSRNPRRGLLFIKRYLQAIWPNIWQAEPLWLRLNNAANYPDEAIPLTGSVPIAEKVTGDYTAMSGQPSMLYYDDATGRWPMLTSSRTNYVQNNTMVGAEIDSWGAAGRPNRWVSAGFTNGLVNGLAVQTTEVGTKNGISYVRVKITGTPTATAGFWWRSETGQTILAAKGQVWTSSLFFEAVSDAGISSITHTLYETTSANATTKNTAITLDKGQYAKQLGAYRPAVVRSLTEATTTAIFAQTTFNYVANVPVNAEFLIGMPQIERSSIASLPIPTSNAGTVTVAADYTVNSTTGMATFRAALGVPATCIYYFLTGRVRVTLPVSSDNGLGLTEIAKAFRSTLPARLMLEFKLGMQFETTGANGGVQLANGAGGIMPITAIGTLQL